MTGELVLAIDQGTTSTRAIAYDGSLHPVASATRPLMNSNPRPGWVEADPLAILDSVVDSVGEVLEAVGGRDRIACVGLDNQGETVVAWDAATLEPLEPAIAWQCRRSLPIVERLKAAGAEPSIVAKTGLPLDPYFSASKLAWLLEESPAARSASARGTLRLGTVDAWLTARLGSNGPGGRTDHSTASRTQLLDLATLDWGDGLLATFGVDRATLPLLGPTMGILGSIDHTSWGGAMALTAMACDQQAALAGHGAFLPGQLKATYGTGVFVVANAGTTPIVAEGIEASVGWTRPDVPATYVLQGGVLSAGSLVDWLQDDLGLVATAAETGRLAMSVADSAGVRILPALTGLGSPWYRPAARAVIAGVTAGADRRHVVRAALDGICHRVCDVVDAMAAGMPWRAGALRVDGGLTANEYLLQRQADLLGLRVDVAMVEEATALGIAGLAAMSAGRMTAAHIATANPTLKGFEPGLSEAERLAERSGWRRFVDVASTL